MKDLERADMLHMRKHPLILEGLHADSGGWRACTGAHSHHDVGLGPRIQAVRLQRAGEHVDANRRRLLAVTQSITDTTSDALRIQATSKQLMRAAVEAIQVEIEPTHALM